MTLLYIIMGGIATCLFIYLMVALLKPELFP